MSGVTHRLGAKENFSRGSRGRCRGLYYSKNPSDDVISAKIILSDIVRVILGPVRKRTRHELQIREVV